MVWDVVHHLYALLPLEEPWLVVVPVQDGDVQRGGGRAGGGARGEVSGHHLEYSTEVVVF